MSRWWTTHSRTTVIKWIPTNATIVEWITTEVFICTKQKEKQIWIGICTLKSKTFVFCFKIKYQPKTTHAIAARTRRWWSSTKYWIIATITTAHSTSHWWTTAGSSNTVREKCHFDFVNIKYLKTSIAFTFLPMVEVMASDHVVPSVARNLDLLAFPCRNNVARISHGYHRICHSSRSCPIIGGEMFFLIKQNKKKIVCDAGRLKFVTIRQEKTDQSKLMTTAQRRWLTITSLQ